MTDVLTRDSVQCLDSVKQYINTLKDDSFALSPFPITQILAKGNGLCKHKRVVSIVQRRPAPCWVVCKLTFFFKLLQAVFACTNVGKIVRQVFVLCVCHACDFAKIGVYSGEKYSSPQHNDYFPKTMSRWLNDIAK